MDWKIVKTIDMLILAIAAISLLVPEGVFFIPALTEMVFGIKWTVFLAAGLGYVAYSFYTLFNR